MPVIVTDIAPIVPLLRCASRTVHRTDGGLFITQCTAPPTVTTYCQNHIYNGIPYRPASSRHPRLRYMLDAFESTDSSNQTPLVYRGLTNVGNTCYLNAIVTAIIWAFDRAQLAPTLQPLFEHITGGAALGSGALNEHWERLLHGSSITNINHMQDAAEAFEHICDKHLLQWKGIQTATYTDVLWRIAVPDHDTVLQDLICHGEIKPAKYIAIQLKIFKNNLEKNMHNIRINKTLNIDGVSYELKSIVLHVGASINHGHYVSLCKVGEDWLTFDDETVSVDMPGGLARPYLCFYKLK